MKTTDPTGPAMSQRSAWRAADYRDHRDYSLQIPPPALAELRAGAKKARESGVASIGAGRLVQMPNADRFMGGVLDELKSGRGFAVLTGIDADTTTPDEMEAMYCLLGCSLGNPVSQSPIGDRIGYVQDVSEGDPAVRGYKSRQILPMHTDGGDIAGLMAIRAAMEGGTSVISSVHAAYDDIRQSRPDLVRLLERGFYYHRRGEQKPGQPIVTPYRIPVFKFNDGGILSHYVRPSIEAAALELNQPLGDEEIAALDMFDAVVSREDNRLEFDLAPGQILLMNNYTTVHARTEFRDWPEPPRRRLLLRVWWDNLEWAIPSVMRVYENEGGRGGVDPRGDAQDWKMTYPKGFQGTSFAGTNIAYERASR